MEVIALEPGEGQRVSRREGESETDFLARYDTYYVDRPHPADET